MIKKIIKYILIAILLLIVALLVYTGILFVQENKASAEVANNVSDLQLSVPYKDIVDEESFEDQMHNVVKPYISTYEKVGHIQTDDNLSLRYKTYVLPDGKANVCICYGCCEFIEKYDELIYYFLKAGFNVYILDHRGMGESARELDDKDLVYVKNYDKYVSDYKKFLNEVVDNSKSKILFSHSMGGAISAMLLEQMPNYFEKAVLSSPMIKYSAGDIPLPLAKVFGQIMCIFGQEKQICLGLGRYSTDFNFEASYGNSEPRYIYNHKLCNSNEKFQTCAVTYGWLRASSYDLDTMYEVDNLQKIQTNCLVFKASEDTMVKNYGVDHFANNVKNVTYYQVDGSKHEIYMNQNSYLSSYLSTIFEFLNK